ncbi:hypothetical protein [Haloferula sp. A504]|uniref:hypothetical protein n=1 Tax=Haloferula sp. A504 TaxID=3373601 RepID=UPI0031C7A514|nr:hypothetical protein [Verrucomicrobiaceae bacterium E54]
MSATLTAQRNSDVRLWLMAMLASVGINGGIILVLAVLAVRSLIFAPPVDPSSASAPKDRVMTIQPVTRAEETPAPAKERLGFARTSEDQPAGIPEDPDFIGERDTLGTSETAPDPDAPDRPSQDGIAPRVEGEMETTESDYQDGRLDIVDPAGVPAEPTVAAPPTPPSEAEEAAETAEASESTSPPPLDAPEEGDPGGRRETLAESPFPVDRPVPPEMAEEEPKSVPENEEPAEEAQEQVEESPKEKPPAVRTEAGSEPGFRGFQRKTELKGSISRQGRSALDVKAGPLGAYHAALSRAIEREWQRQVVRNRDFITPGVLRIRVVLDENGRVRSVGTVEEVGVGTIQKGFTHMAIRDADLPEMPAAVKRELDGEPLELLYNFIF